MRRYQAGTFSHFENFLLRDEKRGGGEEKGAEEGKNRKNRKEEAEDTNKNEDAFL